ncbi:hypothetical protein H1W37_03390 [Stappia taiwanensis]|uniref:HAD family hydrolase n=1 Tax=Stappia taiwanensis TaxID=992267 RepID=A0A838XUL9_9HYPH|nr:hypothetical protein [Stappia taiwanensis]MBA4610683.1 hypothetical protein [Stappia taiwanensis]GGE83009.1 hypothetical protein GCM10007285_08160 [Stappia taiwanensis]
MAEPGRPTAGHSARALILCDVDEVVLNFIPHFEDYMGRSGLRFVSHEYRLAGNIADDDGQLLGAEAIPALLAGFFDGWCDRQTPVPGAATALASLSRHADVMFLTNLPGAQNREPRVATLRRLGMDFPLVTNSGPKGDAAATLAAGRTGPLVFIDDSPVNIRSVAATVENCILIQFIADQRFRDQAGELAEADLKTGDWSRAEAYIRQRIAS